MRSRVIVPVAVSFALSGTAFAAPDARPRGTYIPVDPAMVARDVDRPVAQDGGGSLILYLNRCEGGETVTPGQNDSRNNRSSIVDRTRQLPPYPYGDASWQQMVDCVREIYAFSGVMVTDVDPGNISTLR